MPQEQKDTWDLSGEKTLGWQESGRVPTVCRLTLYMQVQTFSIIKKNKKEQPFNMGLFTL